MATKLKTTEMDNIREDIQSLKGNIVALSKKMEAEGRLSAAELKAKAMNNVSSLQDYSKDQLAAVEKEIKAKPAQSVAIAFGAGLVLSLLMRRGS